MTQPQGRCGWGGQAGPKQRPAGKLYPALGSSLSATQRLSGDSSRLRLERPLHINETSEWQRNRESGKQAWNTVESSICSSLSTPHTCYIYLSMHTHTGTLYLLCTSCAHTALLSILTDTLTCTKAGCFLYTHTPAQTHPVCSLYALMHTYAHEHTIFVCVFTHSHCIAYPHCTYAYSPSCACPCTHTYTVHTRTHTQAHCA